ncbi:MAG TPA: DUF2628 domain-containing protein [Geminicoccaceae bacterium]|nr:DUF2628 domain-containing protein [Geminicoccaceae bacterium]
MLQVTELNRSALIDKPASPGGDEPVPSVRPFGRLRQPPAPPESMAGSQILNSDSILPIDSTKTFVGPNGTYYDERWRWMEWRGQNRSWNWSAALTLGGWLAYRRLYAFAVLYLGWLGLLLLMGLNGVSPSVLAVILVAVAVAVGMYGNTLYMQRFRNMASKVAHEHKDHAARLKALAASGGVDRRAVWIMALSGLGLAGVLIGFEN